MQLFIEIANYGRTITLDANETDTTQQLKNSIQKQTNIPIDKQKLLFCGKPLLYENKTLNEYHITDFSIIYVNVSISNTSIPINTTSSTNYHSILPLIEETCHTKHIYECDINSTLMQIIQVTEAWQFPINEYQCQISMSTPNLNDELQLTYQQINIEPLYKIHPTIREGEAFRIICRYWSQSNHLICRQKWRIYL